MLYLILVFIVLIILFIFLWYKWLKLDNFNQCPLEIRTFDGTHSPYHPSVIFFENSWNNYRYYMAETPFFCGYPMRGDNYRDRFECPSIHVSADGVHWEEKTKNPIDILNETDILNKDYFSDPHLVFSDLGLECWYRINRRLGIYENDNNVLLLRKISKDGVFWSKREILADLTSFNHPLGNMIISPSVIYSNKKYHIWFVDSISHGQRNISYSCYNSGIWDDKKKCNLYGAQINPWHIDVAFIDKIYWLIVFDRINLSLWKSVDGFNFYFKKVLLNPSKQIGSFYYNNLYRACLIKNKQKFRLYFSSDDTIKTYLGLMEGDTPETLEIVSIDSNKNKTFITFLYTYFRITFKKVISVVKRSAYLYIKRPIMILLNK